MPSVYEYLSQKRNSESELAIMTDIQLKYAALEAEVSALRRDVSSLKETTNTRPASQPRRTFARVSGTAPTPAAQTDTIAKTTSTTARPQQPSKKFPRNNNNRPSRDSRPKVKVDGARRIWGTVPTCSAGAVAATITKLIPHNLQLHHNENTSKQ